MPRHPERRDLVLGVLRRARRPVAAEEAVRRVRAAHPRVGRATVYRALRALVSDGTLERYATGYGAPDRSRDHHHVVCGLCGRTVVPRLAEVESALATAVDRAGYRMVAHEIRIDARCAEHPE